MLAAGDRRRARQAIFHGLHRRVRLDGDLTGTRADRGERERLCAPQMSKAAAVFPLELSRKDLCLTRFARILQP